VSSGIFQFIKTISEILGSIINSAGKEKNFIFGCMLGLGMR